MFKSMMKSLIALSLLSLSLLSHASSAITVTYANGTLSFPQNDTGAANYVVHVDNDVMPKNTALSFTAAIPTWATQITTGISACASIPICARPFPLHAGQSCCLMLSLDGAKLNEGSSLLQPQVITRPAMYNSYAAPKTVTVTSNKYTVGGTITGLAGTVTLLNNGTNPLTTSTDGNFTFTTALTNGGTYAVTVQTQPTNQTCTVNNASGNINGANVTNVTVTCSTNTHTVGGNITGLSGSVTLLNNGGDLLTTSSNGPFTFSQPIAEGSGYNVTVGTQPSTQTCSVSNGVGTMGSSNVTNVTVTCSTNTHTIGGTITGLSGSVTLLNNGGDLLTTSSNGPFTFSQPIAEGSGYNVTVGTQPSTQTCNVSNGVGTMSGSNVTNIGVSCVSNNTMITVPPTGTIPTTASGTFANMVTVTNTGTEFAALNVRAELPSGWTAVTQDATDCTSISPGGTCNLVFLSTQPYVAQGNIVITGDNIPSPPTMALAFTIQGYLVFSVESATSANVIDSVDSSPSQTQWGNFVITNAQSFTDGPENTDLIQGTSGIGNGAALNCYNSTTGGVTAGTWYLPAICQMGGENQGAGCTSGTANIDTNLVQLGFGELAGRYWSSTESSDSPQFGARYQDFTSGGGNQNQTGKNEPLRVRCSRALTI